MVSFIILKCNSDLSFFNINPYFHTFQLAPSGFNYAKRNLVLVSSLEAFFPDFGLDYLYQAVQKLFFPKNNYI